MPQPSEVENIAAVFRERRRKKKKDIIKNFVAKDQILSLQVTNNGHLSPIEYGMIMEPRSKVTKFFPKGATSKGNKISCIVHLRQVLFSLN